MQSHLPPPPAAGELREQSPGGPPAGRYPYATWGPGAALLALFIALSAPILAVAVLGPSTAEVEDPSTGVSIALQLVTVAAFLAAPLVLASAGGATRREALRRLGVRGFRPSALGWMALAVLGYLAFAAVYSVLVGEPEQEDIADSFGPVPVQILIVVLGASVGEEVCFRGMLFGGMRRRMPAILAAFLSAGVFGVLHLPTGPSAVPVLIAFGFVLALLYERTGSVVPGIVLHMLNNSAALLAQ